MCIVAFFVGFVLMTDLGLFPQHEHFRSLKSVRVVKGSEKSPATIKNSSVAKYDYILKVVTVNLPPGEKFLHIIPKEQVQNMRLDMRGSDAYVTANRSSGELPRKITIWGPGSTPYSWEPLLYIQEH